MKNYKAPELEVVKFSHEDIMTASSGGNLEPTVKMNFSESEANYTFSNNAEYYTLD